MSVIPIDTGTEAAKQEKSNVPTVHVWDLPLRIFHWSLVLAILAAYLTGEFGGGEWADWHGRIGSFVLALLVFRLIWGFIGTRHARFGNFLPTPARVAAYLNGRWRGVGHNPLGALSVIALLAIVGAQVATGLFANDDIAFAGPLAHLIDKGTSEQVTSWHEQIFYVLAGLIGLHIGAIVFYLVFRRTNLVAPMVTGKKPVAEAQPATAEKHLAWRFVAAVVIAVTVSWLTFRDAPSPATEATPAPAATADW